MVPRFVMFRRLIVLSIVGLAGSASGADSPPVRIVRPLRQLELVTGEKLAVEFLGLDERGIDFRWHGRTRCHLPLAAICSLANPPGVIDHWDESFENLRADDPAADPALTGRRTWLSRRDPAWTREVVAPIASGELSFWQRVLVPGEVHKGCVVNLWFAEQDNIVISTLWIQSDGTLRVIGAPGWQLTYSQPLKPDHDWKQIVIEWGGERCEVRVANAVHSVFKTGVTAFHRLELREEDRNETAEFAIDDVILREFDRTDDSRHTHTPDSDDQDVVTLNTGDQLFGQFATPAISGGVALRSPQGDWTGGWSDIQRLDFTRRPLPPHYLAPVKGWSFNVRLPPPALTPPLTETLRGIRFTDHTIRHPWLGEMGGTIPPGAIVDPLGWGEFRWLKPDRAHLGDEIRDDLTPAVPIGTELDGTVSFETCPTGSTWFVLDVAELEPSGPDTLPTQPFLETLRGGGLRTELVVNDRTITDLNRFVSIRTPPNKPQRLWLKVPSETWRAGTNTWALRQRPLSPTKPQYDDCAIGRIALWVAP